MIQRTWKCPAIHLFVIAIFLFVPTTSFQSSSFSMQLMKPRTSYNSISSSSRNGHGSPITAPILKIASTTKKTELKAEAVGVADTDENNKKQKVPFPIVIWRFTRPHTLIGSALAIPALHIFAAPTFQEAFRLKTAISAIYAMVPSLLMNLYITGLNQITDVEIDKINKPNLPIAAGDLSTKTATIVVTISLILSLALGLSNPNLGTQGLNIALWGSMVLGTMYSLHPFRLKRFPLLAAFCIVAVRGTIINAGFYAHAKAAAFSSSTAVANGVGVTFLSCMADQRCFLSSLFFAIFGIVIGT
jgi:homogentisate phytyltransferase/homogentisate geranylgeranyltransferase